MWGETAYLNIKIMQRSEYMRLPKNCSGEIFIGIKRCKTDRDTTNARIVVLD